MKKTLLLISLMLGALVFPCLAGQQYDAWAWDNIREGNNVGIVPYQIYLSDYRLPVKRIHVAEMIVKAYENLIHEEVDSRDVPRFKDCYDIVSRKIAKLGIMNGYSDGNFGPYKEVTRQEMAKIILMFDSVVKEEAKPNLPNYNPGFSDYKTIADWAKPYVTSAFERGLVKGYNDGKYQPEKSVSAQEAITLVLRCCKLEKKNAPILTGPGNDVVVSSEKGFDVYVVSDDNYKVYMKKCNNDYSSTEYKGDGERGKAFKATGNFDRNSAYEIFAECNGVFSNSVKVYTDKYNFFIKCSEDDGKAGRKIISWNRLPGVNYHNVTVIEHRNTRRNEHIAPNKPKEHINVAENCIYVDMYPNCSYTIKLSGGGCTNEAIFYASADWDYERENRILANYPQSREEANLLMVTIQVPVWRLVNGRKQASTASITVHKEIAEPTKAVFTEIFNGKEKFPIKDVGAYNWRGGRTEHNSGTAIDINSNENYCIYSDGRVIGSHWLPDSDPYSIKPYGDVVRAFEKHGFTWGGDAWSEPSPRDYMHFSYLGT